MKIAILTLSLETNIGGILQAYALQRILREAGHEVETLQMIRKHGISPLTMFLRYAKRLILSIIGRQKNSFFAEKERIDFLNRICHNTDRFVNDNMRIRYTSSLKTIPQKEYDLIVVGSDQVFRKSYFQDCWRTSIKEACLFLLKIGILNDWLTRRLLAQTT